MFTCQIGQLKMGNHRKPIRWTIVYCILEIKVGTKKYQSADHLKKALRRQWHKTPQSHFRAAYDGFIDRLKAIVCAKDGQFEQI